MNEWFKNFLNKVGLENAVKIYENSPDKKPDDFDVDQVATDFLTDKEKLFTSSDSYKDKIKETTILAYKNLKKQQNKDLDLGLTDTEAANMSPEDFNKHAKTVFETKLTEAKSGKTSEWQDKYNAVITEFNNFKNTHQTEISGWETKYKDLETKDTQRQTAQELNQIFESSFGKKKWGDKPEQVENARDIILARASKDGVKWRKDGSVYIGENDVVKSKDSHTVIKDLDSYLESIGKERALFPQANSPEPPKPPNPLLPPTTDPNVAAALAHAESMNIGNF